MANELTKKDVALSTPIDQIKGLEGFDNELLIIPRLKIVQSLSEEAKPPIKLEVGSLCNNLTMQQVAAPGEPLKIVPLLIGKSRIKFIPMGEGGGISCMAKDNKTGIGDPGGSCSNCPHRQWTKDKKGNDVKPLCTQLINIPVICPDLEDLTPMMLSFSNTTFKQGRRLTNLMAAKRANPWKFTYEVRTKYVDDDKGAYYVFEPITAAGLTDEGLVEMFESAYDMLVKDGYEVNDLYADEEFYDEDQEVADVDFDS